ncbi:MAG: GMC family oxidoreductase [Chromatiales bacterium]|nr:GMC family oxidoreductase [Chromatiales bacterium]
MTGNATNEWDYVIVGSGAGGGTLAARLAEAGMRVCLLEAGGDPVTGTAERMPDDYTVPAFHAFACENPAMSWGFKVRHYADEGQQARDPKYQAGEGVFYPRAAALGGCTAHNAMIFMLPHESDWNRIARLTGDASWSAANMRRYARRLEACHHRPLWRALRRLGIDPTGHGWDGWLDTEIPIPAEAMADDDLVETVIGTARAQVRSKSRPLTAMLSWLRRRGDPNSRTWLRRSFEGLCFTPVSTRKHIRIGSRERLLQVATKHPDRLYLELDALATRVLFDDQGRARGVEYLKGERLYRAHVTPTNQAGERREALARREVVLCGGAFNTPQLLMLSGLGPAEHLREHGIGVRCDLPGVGANLQDRYEIAITHRMRKPWEVLNGAEFAPGDPLWQRWNRDGGGLYGSNGAAISLVRRSPQAEAEPDIYCMALLARFEGYFDGFSKLIRDHQDVLTWAVLKGHTRNRAGWVRLRSADPRDTPAVDFRYFDQRDDADGKDLAALVDAIRYVRRMTAPLIEKGVIAEEMMPGHQVQDDEALARYVRDTAWGHHASCSCPIGKPDEGGVLDSAFRVHGVRGLRVVDASAFPQIPGFFLVSAVYMIGEKAADVILADARH